MPQLSCSCACLAAVAVALFCTLVPVDAANAPQLRMAEPTVLLPPLGTNSEAEAGDVSVAVRLLGPASKAVTASLRLLQPPVNASSSDGSDGVWAPADPTELWLEPATLSWKEGEPAGAKHVRLRSVAELPLAVVLEGALYELAGSDSSLGSSNSVTVNRSSSSSTVPLGLPLLRVELTAASGAAIDQQQNSTTLILEESADEDSGSDRQPAPSTDPEELDDIILPLFGFIANQAAYPPTSSSSNGSNDTSTGSVNSGGVASIPVRLLAGQLRERATLKFVVRLLNGGAINLRSRQQFLPSKSMSGFLYFEPAPVVKAAGGGEQGQAAAQQQLITLPLAWDRIPPEAEYRLGLELEPIYHARVQPQPDAVALHVFGTPLGTCPPGSAVKLNGSSSQSGGSSSSNVNMRPISSSNGGFAEEAEFGLFLNGTVIDLSLLETDVREYAAMVESDVPSVTLCLRAGSQEAAEAVQIAPASVGPRPAAALTPASAEVAESACGCDDAPSLDSSSSLNGEVSGSGSCEYVAWVLPLQAGQNHFTVKMPAALQTDMLTPSAENEGVYSMSMGSSGEQYSLAVVRLADPEHAELESITVRSSDDTTVLLCGPSSRGRGRGRKMDSRAALDMGEGSNPAAASPPPKPCVPGELLSLNVSYRSNLISLTPALRTPHVAGVRVEVNGQVLSRGGDVAADQLEDTTAAQQQRSNASFLPSAFILGLLPGSRLDAEVVVVAEDGVTTRRYPIEFVVVASHGGETQQLAVADSGPAVAAASEGSTNTSLAATLAARQKARPRGWPQSPALQPMCTVCPAGWAAGLVNSSACHMCPPGTYARAERSAACQSCGPGTFAYSWGSAYCKNCIEGTYSPRANSSLCLPCPANTTTVDDGQSSCDIPLRPGTYQEPRYAVVVSFWVILTGVDPEDVVVRAGVNAAPEAIVTSLIRADTAQQFNISIDDVQVVSVRKVARRTLRANVTATLGVDVPAGATDEDIAAAMEVERLSADDPIEMLSSDPDRFFGRTTKTLEVQVESAVQATTESRPGGTNIGLLWGMLAPGILAILAGIAMVTLGCRKSRACTKWREKAVRRISTTRLAPKAVAYSRYSGSSSGGSSNAA